MGYPPVVYLSLNANAASYQAEGKNGRDTHLRLHLLLNANPHIGIVKIVGQIKGYTAHMLRTEFPWMKKRLPSLWTRSTCISSVGAVTLDVVKQYIDTQKGV